MLHWRKGAGIQAPLLNINGITKKLTQVGSLHLTKTMVSENEVTKF